MDMLEKNRINDVETVTISRIEYENMQAQIQWLMEQLQLIKKKQFDSSSEKADHAGMDQINLFTEKFDPEPTDEPEETINIPAHTRKQRKSGSVKDVVPDGIPEEIVEHGLSEEERICPACGAEMQVIGSIWS